jgi:hypothetical protein
MSSRNFTIASSENNVTGGTFSSAVPYNAAKKAARKLFTEGKSSHNELRFVLRETTADSKKKEYHYVAIKHVLKEPRIIKRGDVEITVGVEYKVKSVPC